MKMVCHSNALYNPPIHCNVYLITTSYTIVDTYPILYLITFSLTCLYAYIAFFLCSTTAGWHLIATSCLLSLAKCLYCFIRQPVILVQPLPGENTNSTLTSACFLLITCLIVLNRLKNCKSQIDKVRQLSCRFFLDNTAMHIIHT